MHETEKCYSVLYIVHLVYHMNFDGITLLTVSCPAIYPLSSLLFQFGHLIVPER
jgi:hypothetical protein